MAGYWREEGEQWQWVAGFWARETTEADQKVTYLPAPPKAPEVAQPGRPPAEDSFYVPGSWMWTGDRYAWRAGYWGAGAARLCLGVRPLSLVALGLHLCAGLLGPGSEEPRHPLRPGGHSAERRHGWLHLHPGLCRSRHRRRRCPVRPPAHCHYYFGDYYGPTYASLGYESCFVYSRRRYDSIVVYECYERRREPAWISLQINLFNDRCAGRARVRHAHWYSRIP